jgi:putative transport protein
LEAEKQMELFNGVISITGVSLLTFTVFAVTAIGYLLGRITIKGVNLGTAGVFIVALVYGCFLYGNLQTHLTVGDETFVKQALKIVENLGLILFVTSVGFIAGSNFFRNLKKNFKSYVLLGLVIILSASLVCVLCIFIGANFTDLDHNTFKSVLVGLLSGALTSTPAFSASKEAVDVIGDGLSDYVSLGYGIAYLFGVIGVVLFVQLVPKFAKADMSEELKKIAVDSSGSKKRKYSGKKPLLEMDSFGLMPFSTAAIIGVLVGSINVAGFSLTTTGGCILVALVFGHFGYVGRVNIMPNVKVLRVLREFGLVLFLIGAGVSGGAMFVANFNAVYLIYGFFMTLIPMIVGFLFAKYVLKLPLLNNLGSITGGMTSTPALGTLISVAGTEDISSAYAATYPIALIAIVLASKLIVMFC